jgi:hypothetical protein
MDVRGWGWCVKVSIMVHGVEVNLSFDLVLVINSSSSGGDQVR